MQRFPRLITDINALESELFFEYQAPPDDEFPVYFNKDDKSCALITFGTKYLKQIDLYSGQPRFKYLAEFVKLLLLTPHCNSYCETVSIRKIFTDCRHNVGKDATPGHLSYRIYTETTSIRNNQSS